MKDANKKLLLFSIPMSICNFRCHYCYLAQRPESYQGVQPEMKYTPEQVAKALSVERVGGTAYMNFCADGETLLVKDIDLYIKALVSLGHYAEIVTNLTIAPMLDRILQWEPELLKRVEFKCSFHYLELKKKNLLSVFAEHVHRIWRAGASANIEITPSDELIPYIPEVKRFSMEQFGALPHLTIARDDRTHSIDYLTKLPQPEYCAAWSQFDSSFWEYKRTIFGKKQTDFCYAGAWSLYIDLTTGMAMPCYGGNSLGDVFAHPERPLPEAAIGRCPFAHCYNGHMFLTLGLIPGATDVGYGDIRSRVKQDGTEWLQPEMKAFLNTKLQDSNRTYSDGEKRWVLAKNRWTAIQRLPKRVWRKAVRSLRGKS